MLEERIPRGFRERTAADKGGTPKPSRGNHAKQLEIVAGKWGMRDRRERRESPYIYVQREVWSSAGEIGGVLEFKKPIFP